MKKNILLPTRILFKPVLEVYHKNLRYAIFQHIHPYYFILGRLGHWGTFCLHHFPVFNRPARIVQSGRKPGPPKLSCFNTF